LTDGYKVGYKQAMENLRFYLTPAELKWLKAQAKKTGYTVSDFLRRLIDAAMVAK
jgi:hypothetical protein